MRDDLRKRLQEVGDRIAAACERAGRSADSITLIAVTKTIPAADILDAIDAGVRHIGENRVQEAQKKFPELPAGVVRHLIGHLQTNKSRHAVGLFDWIHSLDSLRLAESLGKRAAQEGRSVRCLVQVNASREPTKYGLDPDELLSFLAQVGTVPGIEVRGLMAMAPHTDDEVAIRRAFVETRSLFEAARREAFPGVTLEHLSMGMSGDFEIAIEEGATMVRIGSAIFGPRGVEGDRRGG